MSLLSDEELHNLVDQGVIIAPHSQVNGSSIDLTLHPIIRIEDSIGLSNKPIDLYPVNGEPRQSIATREVNLNDTNYPIQGIYCGYILRQDEFVLGSTNEMFHLPANISCEYKLKSTQARNAMEHLNAGWCDAGWNNSQLTLELKNVSRFHKLILRPNMPIGQMVFFKHTPVRQENSYAIRGQYNGQQKVTESKGLRINEETSDA